MIVDAGKTKGGGLRVAAGLPSGRKALPSRFSWASNLPGPQLVRTFFTVASSTSSISANALVGRRGDDGADVQIAIGPAVETAPNAGHERIVDGGMAQRALDADGFEQLAVFIEESGHAQHGVGLEQQQRVGRIVEIDLAGLDGGRDIFGTASISTFRPLERLFGLSPGPTPPNFSPWIAWCSLTRPPQKSSLPNVS